jgi:hypothetical protein
MSMPKLRRRVLVIAIVPSLVGCSHVVPPGPPAPNPPMVVAASFGRTWDAVIEQFAEQTIPIKTIERASGLVATDQLTVDPSLWSAADCGKDRDGRAFVPSHVTYNVLVRGDSARSTVRVTVRWMSIAVVGVDVKSLICSTRATWETSLEDRVKQSAERKR